MLIEYTVDGKKVTHDNGIVAVTSLEDLQGIHDLFDRRLDDVEIKLHNINHDIEKVKEAQA